MNRVLNIVLRGRAEGVDAMFNRMNAGLSQTHQGFRKATNEAGIFERQMRAVGTTARYALAGGLVFGITGAVQKLNDLQVAMGNIDTVASRPGGIAGLGNQFNQLRDSLVRTSIDTITPINDLAASVTNLYSSLRNDVPVKEVGQIASTVARIARTSQITDQRLLVGSLIGGVNAFGLPSGPGQLNKSVGIMGDQFKYVLQKSINISGEEYAGYAGNLYKSGAQAGLTSPEVGGLVIEASKFGGTASSIIPNLNQMLTNLRHPRTKMEKAAYAEAGITQADMLSPSGLPILRKLITHVKSLGITGGAGALGENNDAAESLGDAGVSGPGSLFISRAFGRIQSQRTLATLTAGGDPLGVLDQSISGVANSAGTVKDSFDRFYQDAPLAAFGAALKGLTTSISTDVQDSHIFGPGKYIGRGAGYVATHPNARHVAEGVLGAALIAGGARAIMRGKLSGKGAVGAALDAEAAPNLIAGQAGDGSRANPLWVIIHPASWTVGSPGGFGSPLGGNPVSKAARKIPILPIGMTALRVAGPVGVAAAVLAAGGDAGAAESPSNTFHNKLLDPSRSLRSQGAGSAAQGILSAMKFAGLKSGQVQRVTIDGNTKADFTIHLVDKNGREITVIEKRGVPTKLQSASVPPTTRGKNTDTRYTRH